MSLTCPGCNANVAVDPDDKTIRVLPDRVDGERRVTIVSSSVAVHQCADDLAATTDSAL